MKKIILISFIVLLPYLFREEAFALERFDKQVWKVTSPATRTINGTDVVFTEWRLAGDFKIGTSTADADIHTIFFSTSGISLSDAGIAISTTAGQSNIGIKFPDNSLMTTANVGSANSMQSNTDIPINADTDGNGSGEIKFQINGSTKAFMDNDGKFTFNNEVTVSSNVSISGDANFNGASSTVTIAGYIDSQQSIKGWIRFDGTGTVAINDSYNVSSIVDDNVGIYTVNWDIDFGNAFYSAVATSGQQSVRIITTATGSVNVQVRSAAGDLTDDDGIMIIAIGDR